MPEEIGPSAENPGFFFFFIIIIYFVLGTCVSYLKLSSNIIFLVICFHQLKQKHLEGVQRSLWVQRRW